MVYTVLISPISLSGIAMHVIISAYRHIMFSHSFFIIPLVVTSVSIMLESYPTITIAMFSLHPATLDIIKINFKWLPTGKYHNRINFSSLVTSMVLQHCQFHCLLPMKISQHSRFQWSGTCQLTLMSLNITPQ